ncbi:MAG: AraC family transcriptional regulator [Bacteroidota bacterium]
MLNSNGGNLFPERFENEIYYVEGLKSKFTPLNYISNFSLKYVIQGEEHYIVNKEEKKIGSGQYLVVNNQSDVCRLSSSGTSFSIFLGADLLTECYQLLTINDKQLLEYPQAEEKNHVELFDDVIHGQLDFLLHLQARITSDPDLIIPIDLYYELGQRLLFNQNEIFKQINQLDRRKFATRKEVYKRVNIARNYLEDTIIEEFDLNRLSRVASLSKFQLIRDFKDAFGISPHRYFILKKLDLALTMIQSKQYSTLNEIALQLNYSCLSSFSRQFKQVYRVSPTAFINKCLDTNNYHFMMSSF